MSSLNSHISKQKLAIRSCLLKEPYSSTHQKKITESSSNKNLKNNSILDNSNTVYNSVSSKSPKNNITLNGKISKTIITTNSPSNTNILSYPNVNRSSLSYSLSTPLLIPPSEFQSSNTLRNSKHNVIFNKSIRFFKPKCEEKSTKFYNIPSLISKRSAGIGYGKRSALVPLFKTPAPGQYEHQSSIDEKLLKRKGVTIAIKTKQGSFHQGNEVPGPGAYSPNNIWYKPRNAPNLISRKGFYYDEYCKGKEGLSPQTYKLNYSQIDGGRYKKIKIGGIGHGEPKFKLLDSSMYPGVGSYNLPSIFDKTKSRINALN